MSDERVGPRNEYIVPPDEQDKRLGTPPENSIYQRVRLLTPQQRILLDGLLRGLDAGDALREAGYKSRGAIAALQNKIPDLMDRLQLTDENLIEQHLKPLLVAEETQFFAEKGIVKDFRVVAANGIRKQALDMAFRLRGSYARDEDRDTQNEWTVNIVNVGAT